MNEPTTLTIEQAQPPVLRGLDGPARPYLILYSGDQAGQRFDLEIGSVVIGRSQAAGVRIDRIGISRVHAELRVDEDGVEIRDLGSANGSFVNERPALVPVKLKDRDLIRVASTVLRFHDRPSIDAALHEHLRRLAKVDVATGALSRRHLQDLMSAAIGRARREKLPLALICYDLDALQAVNEAHGRAAGDEVLKIATDRVRSALREEDVLGRWAGGEFAVLLRDTTAGQAAMVAERMRASVAGAPVEVARHAPSAGPTVAVRQSISLGVAELTPAMADEFDLLGMADRMLSGAKRAGRNCVWVATPDAARP